MTASPAGRCWIARQPNRTTKPGLDGPEIEDPLQHAEHPRREITRAFRTDLAGLDTTARNVLTWAAEFRTGGSWRLAEVVAYDGIVITGPLVGAWTTKPAH
jgi:hypothetical protein